jgi:hypothetical protein
LVNSFPYLENFETNNGYWYTSTSGSTWQYGTPNSAKIRRAASGTKAWKTNLNGYYDDNELSYLYSPCFNLSGMSVPTLSVSIALDLEDCGGTLCDAGWVEYSTNGGSSWTKLGAFGSGTNWYNKNYSGNHVWSRENYTRWHVATTALPTTNNSSIRFRFVMNSDAGVGKDGIAVDDIHIYDNTNGIYDVTGTSPVVTQTANGTGWVNFIEGGTNKIIAAVNPNGQNMGSTNVQSYVNTGAVRINSDQYYHDRNITIKPATINLADSALVRFYFLDTETEALINATGCGYCYKPAMAYELGVTKYSDPSDITRENGTLADNIPGNYLFINNANVKIVPYDKGYYAEYKVRNFSEFWLNNGGFDRNTPLPAQLTGFTAVKRNSVDVLAQWTTASEQNLHHFELELAKGNDAYQQDRFVKIAEVPAAGNSTTLRQYSFTDMEAGKTGVRYYRLKMVDHDGRFIYSAVRPVVFTNDMQWQVFPNPSAGLFNLLVQANEGEAINASIYDITGKTVQQYTTMATGFVQKILVDLHAPSFSTGLYLLEVRSGDKKQSFRIMKQ